MQSICICCVMDYRPETPSKSQESGVRSVSMSRSGDRKQIKGLDAASHYRLRNCLPFTEQRKDPPLSTTNSRFSCSSMNSNSPRLSLTSGTSSYCYCYPSSSRSTAWIALSLRNTGNPLSSLKW